MHRWGLIAPVLLAISVSSAARADPLGPWHLTGTVDGKPFTSDCTFVAGKPQFGGSCMTRSERDPKGTSRPIINGTFSGDRIRWAYKVSVMFLSVNVTFDATIAGERMTGTVSAANKHGIFTAVHASR
ncbi:hypothetical protein BH10PSE12_BH10PSE12_22530 [soil metagenome]